MSAGKRSRPSPTQRMEIHCSHGRAGLLLRSAIQAEIYRHDFGTYVDGPPSVAQGGNGVVVAGCPACKKRLQSMNEFLGQPARVWVQEFLGNLNIERREGHLSGFGSRN
jgi:hypothetical protein